MGKRISVALAGLGSRGKDTYAKVAKLFPNQMAIKAIADIDSAKVEEVAKEYGIPAEKCYSSAEAMLDEPKLAEAMFITTQDKQHVSQAVPALKKGYHLLLEKPISPDLAECRQIVRVAEQYQRQVIVCHVLRYTPYYRTLKAILDSGRIGQIVTVMGIENVGYWHQAHSFVRGNWRNSEETSPMILQKCCHDMDLMLWLTGKRCRYVSSYGSTYLFRQDKAPNGAAKRCLEGCRARQECPFDAEKIYMHHPKTGVLKGNVGWPNNVLTLQPTADTVMQALREGPYGRCVYYCDNNVVDHQVVNLEMTDGSTISFTMSGFTYENSRYAKFMGTKGDIIADMSDNTINIRVFGKDTEVVDVSQLAEDFSGHAGGDNQMVLEFLQLLSEGRTPSDGMTSVADSVESHYIALAAEQSRLGNGKVIDLEDLRSDLSMKSEC